MDMGMPEVRQCRDEASPLVGCTATAGAGPMTGRWLIANPEQGGYWAPDADVADWHVMS